jgi:hypothetical protein
LLSLAVVALLGATAFAHQQRLSAADIAVIEANARSMPQTEVEKASAALSRLSLKNMYVKEALSKNAGQTLVDVEAEADEWLETIQQAKRAVHKSLGLENIEPRNDGLWQQDILLRRTEAEDIILRHGGELPEHRRKAAEQRRVARSILSFDMGAKQRWVSPITYTFDASLDATKQARIKTVLDSITTNVPCLTFTFAASPAPNSYFMKFIDPNPSQRACGGSAFVGMMSPTQTDGGNVVGNSINIQYSESYCDKCFIDFMIIHEIFHALGMSHEQCRGDRNAFISIDLTNVNPSDASNFDMDTNTSYTPYGQPYHYDSVMHYSNTTLALDPSKVVMKALVQPIDQNTAMMGNAGGKCTAIASDWAMLKAAYCMNPATMTAPIKFVSNKIGCFADATTCAAADSSSVSDPSCPSGYSMSGTSQVGCFPCDGGNCFLGQPGDSWLASMYRADMNAAGTGYTCGASKGGPIRGIKGAVCTATPTACGDSDPILCGWGPLQGSSCSDSAFAAKCPKTCGAGLCASAPGK